ncbi:MAG TPA: ABC transporter ATP-binding protein [Candidatus Competibacteraceae bacterium]|nr:ABC transporter ATP-binding protein [Candidatus Competibacteraceae bacterium]HRZ05221.1 ABC transporter ATP-binding protein [Candidatus Competibacteraceae bacterium]HSA45128.1 ABC transporter ATP-binding protein [Candidatus Competibacteraceae bacterium]
MSTPLILAEELTRHFGDFIAVDHLQVAVHPGEVFGLLGANGAGKTTAIRMLCGMLPPTTGRIQVAGVDMVRHARRARGQIGYVAQRFSLYGDLTVLENLQLQAGLYGLAGVRKRDRLEEVLRLLNLSDRRKVMAGALPLGYRQRLGLAAALLHEPRVLFLDEPTSGVDPLARQRFWELIYHLADGGIGILVTTHYMDEALFCDRLALMQAGRIVAEGTPEELLRRPLPTPILELDSPDTVVFDQLAHDWPEVREIIPHAGQLRIRLKAGVDEATLRSKIQAVAVERSLTVTALRPAAPELEDVFVAVLEESER